MAEIILTEHPLNKCRKQIGLTLWRVKRLLEAEYQISISEGKLSRLLSGVDTPIPEHIEVALGNILGVHYTGKEQ